jgi:hypothetical protein
LRFCRYLAALYWTRHYAELSVQPYITVTPYLEGPGGRNGLYISNAGNGPARITSIDVTVDGRTFHGPGDSPWPSIERDIGVEGCFKRGWPEGETVLRAGDQVTFLTETRATGVPACQLAVLKLLTQSDMKYTIHYASMDDLNFVFEGHAKVNDADIVKLGDIVSSSK